MDCRIICFLLLLCFQSLCYGQTDSILALPRDEQQEAIFKIYHRLAWMPKPRLDRLDTLATSFGKRGREDLEEMIWSLLWVDKYNLVPVRDSTVEMEFMYGLIQEAKDRGWVRAEAECRMRLGGLIFSWRRFSQGMEMMMQSYEYLNRHGWSSPYARVSMLADLGKSYYQFGDYQTCMEFLHESLNTGLPQSSIGFPYKELNTLGLCHMQLQNIDSAIFYFKASHDLASTRQDSFWMALTLGNIGSGYFKKEMFDEALPFLEKDYTESIRLGILGSAVNASTLLASIELQRGRVQKAEEYIAFARTHLDTLLDSRLSFYENLYQYHKLKGEGLLALPYADSVMALKREKERVRDRKVLEQARMKAAYEAYDKQIRGLKQARSRQIQLRNALFCLFIFSALMAFLWIVRVQRKRKAEQQRLIEAEAELQQYIRSLLEKNELIQTLRDRMTAQDIPSHPHVDRSSDIAQLTQLNILTEEDWKHFRKLFDVVYPGFLIRLKEKLGELNPAEIRLLVLTKLQVPQKDMGDMLGISYNSIRTSRYRLRKKLNLPEEGTLEELVEKI